jgi:hypothetical protein
MAAWLAMALGWGRGALAAIWSFATTRPGCYFALAALALLAVWGSGELGYRRGARDGKAACEAVHAAAMAHEEARQHQAAGAAVGASQVRTAASEALDNTNKDIVAHVKVQAAALPPPPAACPLAVPADLADELRALH